LGAQPGSRPTSKVSDEGVALRKAIDQIVPFFSAYGGVGECSLQFSKIPIEGLVHCLTIAGIRWFW
jgi:hypothetical protein